MKSTFAIALIDRYPLLYGGLPDPQPVSSMDLCFFTIQYSMYGQ